MNPLMIGPDGLVGSATRREMTHLAHCLERDVKTSQSKVASRNVPNQKLSSAMSSGEDTVKRQQGMKNCPLCQIQVREDRLQRHMTQKCPSRAIAEISVATPSRPVFNSRTSSRRKSTISLRDIQLFVKCPTCGVKLASDQFIKHRSVAHGPIWQNAPKFPMPVAHDLGRPRRPGVSKRSKKKKAAVNRDDSRDNAAPESARQKGKIEVERPAWWDNLDATKNCGYPAREEGRYGSYPSHDGFDDESKP